jgi:poly(3-hydroxybutyrate) depolymerase
VDAQLSQPLAGIDGAALRPRAGAALAGGLRWTPLAAHAARLDLDAVLHGRGPRSGFAALELVASGRVGAQLFLGSDDGLAVFLDGVEVYRRGAVRDARDDDDRVPLDLAPGRHLLLVKLYVNGGAMRLHARLVDAAFAPPASLAVALPGVDDPTCDALGRAALQLEVAREVVAAGTRLRVRAGYPGGTARREGESTRELRLTTPGATATARLEVGGNSTAATELELVAPASARAASLEGPALASTRTVDLALDAGVRRALLRASTVLDALREDAPPPWLPLPSLTSVRGVAERLASLVSDGDPDASHLAAEARSLESLLDALEHRRDPYATLRGPLRRAYRSEIDGTLQGYSVYVPPGYRGDRPFPLIVALHGLGGTAHRMLPVLFGLYDEDESRTHADRHLPPLPDAGALIVAPYGRGDAGYRALGEVDVMRVLDEVRRAYRVDPDRTYITGISMGGIGAAAIPLHYPDVFAAAAPLCGYHSYFVRRDTRTVRRPWELFLMEARSNASWAENGLHLPLYVVHGTRDLPLDNSRVLVDRYAALHYAIESEWPDLGHNVWSTTYAGGRIVPYFLRHRRDGAPRTVRFRTADVRWRRSYWIEIDALAARGVWGEVEAAVEGARVQVTTRNLAALTLVPPPTLFARSATRVEIHIDGDVVATAPGRALSLTRGPGGHWAEAPRTIAPPLGPVRDVFDRPLAVVYGTQDAGERAMDRRVAEAWARIRPGVQARIPVLADTEVDEAFARSHALVLVGTPRGNAWLARIHARLPIQVQGDAVVAGGLRYAGPEVGATFVVENPEAPGQAVVVVTGTSALGVWRSRFLPDLVPDFAIYDGAIAPARGRVLLGAHARVLAAGFWDGRGQVPANAADPLGGEQAGAGSGDQGADGEP